MASPDGYAPSSAGAIRTASGYAGPALAWLGSTFAALQLRNFRILWIGTVCAHLAFFMSMVVQSVVAFDLVGSNAAVGTVVFAQGVSMLVLGPLGGALADRWPKRLAVAIAQLIPAVVFLGLALAFATDAIQLALVAGGSFFIGVSFAFVGPGRHALVVDVVPDERLRGNAVALAQVASTASQVLGPGIAGVLLYWSLSGPAGAYAVMGVLYLGSSGLLLLLPRMRGRANAADTRVLADVIEGIRYVLHRRRLRLVVSLYVCVLMMGFPYFTVMPSLVERGFGLPAQAFAFLSLVSASGALLSSIVVARYADHGIATVLFGSMGLLFGTMVMVLSTAPSYEVAASTVFFVGAGFGGFMTLNGAVIVRATNPLFFGRVMSLTMLAFAASSLMGLPIGLLADAIGERATLVFLGASVCALVGGFALLMTRLGREEAAGTPQAAG